MYETYHVLFPIRAGTLPGGFLRISVKHVCQCMLHVNFKLLIGGQILSVLPIIESARDCRKTDTWVTYGNMQMQARMRMRRKKYVAKTKTPRDPRETNFHRFDLATRSSSSFFCK